MHHRTGEYRKTAIRLYLECQLQMTEEDALNTVKTTWGHVNSQQEREAQEREVVASIPH